MFPYRWLPRTVIPNLQSLVYDIVYGIENLFVYFPVIWKQRDFDWSFLAIVMEFKLRRMSKSCNNHMSSEKDAKRMLIGAELLKRMVDDSNDNQKYYQDYLGKLIGKHFRSWWD